MNGSLSVFKSISSQVSLDQYATSNTKVLTVMRAVVQRVSSASVEVEGSTVGQIERGLLVFLGVGQGDGRKEITWMAEKVASLRIFQDEDGKMNRSLVDTQGSALVVSQFTLYGDCRKGRRPSFIQAAAPEEANQLYEEFVAELRGHGIQVATGTFQATMRVASVNEGPITMLIDSEKRF
ncbi:D-aminoacyl-tRNA deacylase [Rubinisphaera sp.]|uniref:D-aminoacyl-tRNA deacylase n=2 Tax=Rubinisphaera TaxID=1649490 RepID=UPI0025F7586E|nr:D-aminoacyl-tRNA deacylase [Rubinisphaera sp.]|tara:strand:- start:13990 stop:14529 length:540 start_codon:yes stop_codon:yes gene_type:complete